MARGSAQQEGGEGEAMGVRWLGQWHRGGGQQGVEMLKGKRQESGTLV